MTRRNKKSLNYTKHDAQICGTKNKESLYNFCNNLGDMEGLIIPNGAYGSLKNNQYHRKGKLNQQK